MAKRKTLEPYELREILRRAIHDSGKSVYQLCKEAELDQGQLHAFLSDTAMDMRLKSAEKLCRVLGLTLTTADLSD